MQVVIDTKHCPCRTLNDECYISSDDCFEDDICSTCPLIRNGGVKLPKGHGALVDRGEIIKSFFDYHKGKKTLRQCIEDVQTIIEVDWEDEEE